MGGYADGSVPGTAAAVRDRERLMQVEVHEIEAHIARPRVAHERVRIGAVVVHQSARRMNGSG